MKTLVIIIVIIILLGGGYYLFTHSKQGNQGQLVPAPTQTTGSNQTGSQQYAHPTGARGFGRGQFGSMPSGSTPIFGQVTAVSGNTLTVKRQSRNGNGTAITIDLTSSTQYTGGSQSDITSGTRIAGY